MTTVKEIETMDDFSSMINNSKSNLSIVDFYTNFCEPCKRFAPKYTQMAENHINILFYKLNAENPLLREIISACEITHFPTFCFFRDGNYITKTIGANEGKLESLIRENL